MVKTEVSYADGCLDESILRELASYDILCPEITPLELQEKNYVLVGDFSCFHWSRQYEYTWAITKADIKKTDIILDAGSGYSVLKYAIAKRCQKVVALDPLQEAVDISKRTAEKVGVNNIEYIVSSIEDYDTECKYDKIYCISVIEHIENPEIKFKCLEKLMSMLKPYGQLFFSFDFVIEKGKDTYDFYVDKKSAGELLHWFGIEEFESDDISYGVFPSGCVLGVICIKAQNEDS